MKKVLIAFTILASSIASAADLSRAEKALKLAESGFPIVGLTILTRETQVNDLSSELMAKWTPILNTYVTELPPGLEMNASWKRLFSSKDVKITKASEIAWLLKRASSMANDDLDKTRLLWKISTMAPQFNDTKNALKAVTMLKSCKQSIIGSDQIELATARILYQMGSVDKALEHYESIPKSSEFWIEALEERAWAHLRKGDNDAAVSDITTLLSEPFGPITGPEAYFLAQLTNLKICDYPKILRTSKTFKARHKDRLLEISTLAETGTNKWMTALMDGIDKKGFNVRGFGPSVQGMPRDFSRDRVFSTNMKYRVGLLAELKKAENFKEDSDIQTLTAGNQVEADMAKTKAMARLQTLAKIDKEEYRITINKLHVVEAEVIQRLYVDERLKGKRKDVEVAKTEKNTLSFPYTEKEIWMDELDHYKSTVKDCPALPATKGASL